MKERLFEFATDVDRFTLNLESLVVSKASLLSKIPFASKETKINLADIISVNINDEDSTITKLTIGEKGKEAKVFELRPEKTEDSIALREQVKILYLYINHRLK